MVSSNHPGFEYLITLEYVEYSNLKVTDCLHSTVGDCRRPDRLSATVGDCRLANALAFPSRTSFLWAKPWASAAIHLGLRPSLAVTQQ